MEHISKTQHYLKVKKPLLERQRRARINKCLDSMKHIIAELQEDNAILRMDKAEMLEATITHLRQMKSIGDQKGPTITAAPVDGFRNGYINAANEVSRVLASTQGMSAKLGKAVMTHLGCQFNRLHALHQHQLSSDVNHKTSYAQPLTISTQTAPVSPASSGYHSDMGSPGLSPAAAPAEVGCGTVWRPW